MPLARRAARPTGDSRAVPYSPGREGLRLLGPTVMQCYYVVKLLHYNFTHCDLPLG